MRRQARRLAMALLVGFVAFTLGEWALDRLAPYPHDVLRAVPASRVFLAADGSLLRVTPTRDGERRLPVRLADVSPHVVSALLAAEDRRFREHDGVDLVAVTRAAASAVTNGRVVSGASTLTMQLVRLVEPHPRTVAWKLAEMLRARQLERVLGKDEILEHYLSLAPFGGTTRGIEGAARRWCGKAARDLTPGEAAALIAMLPSPTARAPDLGGAARLAAARERVLEAMHDRGDLTDAQLAGARAEPLPDHRRSWPYRAPHHCDLVGRESGALTVRTTIDLALQSRVEDAARRLDAPPSDGLAVVVLDRLDGRVLAHLGSTDYRVAPLDAASCRRSVGSTLKPFLYALALDLGVTGPDALVSDTPLRYADYAPRNFEGEYEGAVASGTALARSRNLPAIRQLQAVGPERFRDVLRGLGLDTGDGALHVDAALGTVAASPLELARAWQRFAGPEPVQALTTRSREQSLRALTGPGGVARKTGTSSGRRDAWCVGVTREHVIVTWLGNLDGVGESDLVGARAASDLLADVLSGL